MSQAHLGEPSCSALAPGPALPWHLAPRRPRMATEVAVLLEEFWVGSDHPSSHLGSSFSIWLPSISLLGYAAEGDIPEGHPYSMCKRRVGRARLVSCADVSRALRTCQSIWTFA